FVGCKSRADDHGPHRANRGDAVGLSVPGSVRIAIFARPLAGPPRPDAADLAAHGAVDHGDHRHTADSGPSGIVGGHDGLLEAHWRRVVERRGHLVADGPAGIAAGGPDFALRKPQAGLPLDSRYRVFRAGFPSVDLGASGPSAAVGGWRAGVGIDRVDY